MLADIPSSIRFQRWFPYLETQLSRVSQENCSETLSNYHAAHLTADTPTCYRHLDCMLDYTREGTKAHMACSDVILGLTPTLLSFIAPSITDIAVLSTHRPILASLLMLGATVTSSGDFLKTEKPAEILSRPESDIAFPKLSRGKERVVVALEYVIALAAIANAVQNSFMLGDRTIVAWKCNVGFLELVWSFVPAVICVLICVPFWYTRWGRALWEGGDSRNHKRSFGQGMKRFWQRELCLTQETISLHELEENDRWSLALMNIGLLLGLLQVIAGSLVLSSILFIAVVDTLPIIIRYAVSTLVCRLIVSAEISRMSLRRKGE